MKSGSQSVGHPIDVATGVMFNTFQDVSISGNVSLEWTRFYSTALKDQNVGLGPGWFNKYFCTLRFEDDNYIFTGPDGSPITIPDPKRQTIQGRVARNYGAFTEISFKNEQFVVCQWNVESGKVWRYLFPYDRARTQGKILPLRAIQDPTRQGVELAYDSSYRLVNIVQKPEQRTLSLNYDDSGLIASIEFLSPDKRTNLTLCRYEYDPKGRLVSATDAAGFSDYFDYDNENRVTREAVKGGGVTTFIYDDKGRCVKTKGLDGYDEKTLRYIESAGWTEVTDSLGNVRRFQRNGDGQILKEINSLNAEYRTDYDDYGRIVSTTNPMGDVISYEYDDQGNRCKTADALNQVTMVAYCEAHLPVTYTNPAGHVRSRIYDHKNRLVKTEDSECNRYSLHYDGSGNLLKIIDPMGNCRQHEFTELGVLKAATDRLGHTTRHRIDVFGRLTCVTDPLGKSIEYSYDVVGNLVRIDFPDETHAEYYYDAANNLTRTVDRSGLDTRYRFGPCSRLLERIDSLGGAIHYSWGSEPGRLETVTNAKGEVYEFTYNSVGWITGETGFDKREVGFEYDAAGYCIARINMLQERIEYQRDALGRLNNLITPEGSQTSFSYDEACYLEKTENEHSQILFERDKMGRIVREIQNGEVIERRYDPIGNIQQLETSLSMHIDYEFDANRMLAEFQVKGHEPTRIERDVYGCEYFRSLPGQYELLQNYDAMGRLLEQSVFPGSKKSSHSEPETPQALIQRNYQYQHQHVVSITDLYNGKTTYSYDPLERVTSALREQGDRENFKYDDNGNIIQIEQGGEVSNLSYAQGDRLKRKGNSEYYFDLQGRLERKLERLPEGKELEWKYEWDALDQLRAVVNPEGTRWNYNYDSFGRRIEKFSSDGKRFTYVWNEDVVLHEIHDNELAVSWVFDPHSYRPLSKIEKNEIYSIITDHLGTPREMIDRFGKIVWQADYFTWGEIKIQKAGAVDCPIRFQGQWWDEESGLHYNRFRYYDPSVGRYICQDPLTIHSENNLYAFVKNPIAWIDPLGLCDDDPDKLEEARAARDALAEELGSERPPARPAAVTAGYNTETGEVAARGSFGDPCAEDHVVAALGGDPSKVRMTEAVRPRPHPAPHNEVPVCERCEASYGRSTFSSGTRFKSDDS